MSTTELESNEPTRSCEQPFRFLFDGAIGDTLRELLLDDVQAAQLSPAFQVFYRVRPFLPIAARQLLQKLRNGKVSDCDQQVSFSPMQLLEHLARDQIALQSVWPSAAEYSLVLTHDVETKQGVRWINRLAEVEEKLGFRSSWNIVPYKYETDPGLIRDLTERGHEFGVHGYNHDGKLFLSKRIFDSRVPAINRAIKELGAVGFRAPMVHRNLHWLQKLDIEYDSSCFDVDPFQAMPGGVGSVWPFIFGRFVELPYTMPQDHTLFVTLGETTDTIWREKLATIRRLHGMALMLTHPDYLDSKSRLDTYRDFLKHIRDTSEPWHQLPREMAAWCSQTIAANKPTMPAV